MLGRLLIVAVLSAFVTSNGLPKRSSVYLTAEIIEADGFPSETHHVTTPDGYILRMHRIPHGRSGANSTERKPVVFLMHGLFGASNAYIMLGPDYGFAYNLADAGFDVWMGNARGNWNSRYHVTLDPDDNQDKKKFFDFSFEEIGMYDLPAMMDYALEHTGSDKLHYIGHSQGGTVFLVHGTMVPEYANNKIKSAHLLAGVGYQDHFPNPDLRRMAAMTDLIYGMSVQMGIVELFPPNSTEMVPGLGLPYTRADYCTGNVEMRETCRLIGVHHILRNDTDDAEEGYAAGAALKQVAHYGQNIRDKQFRRYSHGSRQNQEIYGSSDPPPYNLGLITINVTMHYSLNDNLLDERDVLAMVADLPNGVARQVARASFLHEDFVAAFDAKELVTDFIIDSIKSTERENEVPISPPTDAASTDPQTDPEIADAVPGSASASTAMLGVYLAVISLFVMLN